MNQQLFHGPWRPSRRELLAAGGAAALLGSLPGSAGAVPESPEAFAEYLVEAMELIQESHVKPTKRRELAAWAVRGLYEHAGAKMARELASRLADSTEPTSAELKKLFADARRPFGKREELSELRDVDAAVNGIAAQLDPEMKFFGERRLVDPHCWHWRPTTVGVRLRRDTSTGEWRVFTPLKESPAHKAGLQAGDLIKAVTSESWDGKRTELTDRRLKDLSLTAAEDFMRGRPGTKVSFTLERAGRVQPLEIVVTRPETEPDAETVLGVRRKADLTWDHLLDTRSGIAYIRLTQFGRLTERDFLRTLDELAKNGVKGLVLDLRFSPGGYLDAGVEMADALVDAGVVAHIRPRQGRAKIFKAEKGVRLDVPVVCLMNGETGRMAEVLAAALHDNGRAAVAGEGTPGSVAVQNIVPLPKSGGDLKLTTAVFVRPNGKNLSKLLTNGREDEDWGVRPDQGLEVRLAPVERKLLFEHLDEQTVIPPPKAENNPQRLRFEDRQLAVALEFLRRTVDKPR
jgi:carboxyl-terminal processing protease